MILNNFEDKQKLGIGASTDKPVLNASFGGLLRLSRAGRI
jgi:hypothetical protein